MNNLALLYWRQKKFPQALPLYEEAYAYRKLMLGSTHASTLDAQSNLGSVYESMGRVDDAFR